MSSVPDKSTKLFRKIEGHDGFRRIFEKLLPAGSLSKAEIVVLLQRLSARHLDERI
jgi:hypothetical protein